jgi:RsiW-degrading membrane proteinase PrsW (M82 family)
MLFFKFSVCVLLATIGLAFAYNLLVPGFGLLFFERLAFEKMDMLLVLGAALIGGIYMMKRPRRRRRSS